MPPEQPRPRPTTPATAAGGTAPAFTERLWPGPVGWVTLVGLAAMLGVALLPVSPVAAAAGVVVGLVGGGAAVAALASRVRVADGELHAGSAHIPLTLLRDARPLDAEQTRHELGPGLDARAYLCQRGWVRTAVRVELDDPADPTPYWLVSTRRPAELARALGAPAEA